MDKKEMIAALQNNKDLRDALHARMSEETRRARSELHRFRRKETGVTAMKAIRAITEAGIKMPADLLPWVSEAVTAWEQAKGNKVEVRRDHTAMMRDGINAFVQMLNLVGWTVDDAIKMASGVFDVPYDTLYRRYYGATLVRTAIKTMTDEEIAECAAILAEYKPPLQN